MQALLRVSPALRRKAPRTIPKPATSIQIATSPPHPTLSPEQARRRGLYHPRIAAICVRDDPHSRPQHLHPHPTHPQTPTLKQPTPSPSTASPSGERAGVRGRSCLARAPTQILPPHIHPQTTHPLSLDSVIVGGEGWGEGALLPCPHTRANSSPHTSTLKQPTPSPPTASSSGERAGVRGRSCFALSSLARSPPRAPIARQPTLAIRLVLPRPRPPP